MEAASLWRAEGDLELFIALKQSQACLPIETATSFEELHICNYV
jgi:hypothetical protein